MNLENIKGIGPKTLNILGRLGVKNVDDLISYYPFRYEIIKKIINEDRTIIDGIIEKNAIVSYLKNHRDKLEFNLNSGENIYKVVIFNRGYLKNKLIVGTKVTIIGKFDIKKNAIICSDIKFGLLGNRTIIEPVYHVTTGINSSQLNNLINKLDFNLNDYIPDYLNDKYDFISKNEALKEVHNPSSELNLKKSINKLKYEELFLFMLKINYLKSQKKISGLKRTLSWDMVLTFINSLPFKLTIDQENACKDIYKDLTGEFRMNRLLQGDVGSGKTIVAFIALFINYLGGYQGALMAPTEILARQHYNKLINLFPDLNIKLLIGNLKTKDKRKIYDELNSGKIDIIIGTHALISENVKYNNLGLVITDEQHRFGVCQRSNLKNKGLKTDVLYLSATPIPRTYAITLFGDMDISNIKIKPNGRKEIINYLYKNSDIKEVLNLMLSQLKLKHQIYVIAPLIDESDKIQLENVTKLQDKMKLAFGKYFTVGIMHGKLTNKEKEEVMTKFLNNEIQILISTTVVEVGVDVPNATLMVVFDSYRFGLSSLHQLRGRIGRNNFQSYFVMISDIDAERLKILTKTNDGFKISESDFKLRGSGDLFGVQQSGDMQFKLANLKRDFNMLIKAKEDSKFFLDNYNEKYDYIYNVIKKIDILD